MTAAIKYYQGKSLFVVGKSEYNNVVSGVYFPVGFINMFFSPPVDQYSYSNLYYTTSGTSVGVTHRKTV